MIKHKHFLNNSCKNNEELKQWLDEEGIELRIPFGSGSIFNDYPFMKDFLTGEKMSFSSEKINNYIGFNLIPYQAIQSSYTMNVALHYILKKYDSNLV